MTPAEVRDNPSQHRYEAVVDGAVAGYAEYIAKGSQITFTHTIVVPAFEGQGIGGQLARGALDAAVAAGQTITPQCTFIAGYIKSHPDYLVHVDGSSRGNLA